MRKMLIIEDDDFISKTYTRFFTLSGFDVTRFHNGLLALEFLDTNEILPDIILLDVNLPVMNGREFLKNIKQNDKTKNIPTVVLTNSFFQEDEQEFLDLGADLFLVKIQNNNKDLIEKINDLVERSIKKSL